MQVRGSRALPAPSKLVDWNQPARKKLALYLPLGASVPWPRSRLNLGCGQVFFLLLEKNAFSPFFFFIFYFLCALLWPQIFLSLNVINVIREIAKKLGTPWLLPLVPKINRSLHPQVLQVVIYKLWDERQEILPTTKRLVSMLGCVQVFRKVMRTSIGASFMQEKYLGAPRKVQVFLSVPWERPRKNLQCGGQHAQKFREMN